MSEKIIAKVVDRAQAAIDPAEGIAAVSDPGFGGIDVFIGKVRDFNVGRPVTGITYDLFEPLVLNEIQRLAAEIEATFGPKLKLYVAHAKGRLGIGDVAVVVAAGAAAAASDVPGALGTVGVRWEGARPPTPPRRRPRCPPCPRPVSCRCCAPCVTPGRAARA